MEKTLILVKPDAFARGLTGEIIARFERKGLKIVAAKHMTVTEDLADGHVLGRDDLEALALEARDDLPGQAAREGVRLDEDQGFLHGSFRRLRTGFALRPPGRRGRGPRP